MVYTPQRGGFAQAQYFDQQGSALPGMLANASDINLVDSGFVGGVSPVSGLVAGVGVIERHTVRTNRAGFNYDVYDLPDATAQASDFAGIVVRNQFMRTNSGGEACYFFEDTCNVLSARRVGGRIWVRLVDGATTPGGQVHWIVRDTAGSGKMIGAFAGSAISGTATPTPAILTSGTINPNEVQALGSCGFDFTINGTLDNLSELNFSGASTLSAIAAVLAGAVQPTVKVSVQGNSLVITTVDTGVAATLTYAVKPSTMGAADASNALGFTAAAGATLAQGSAGAASDTVPLVKARYLDTFVAGAGSSMALVELQ